MISKSAPIRDEKYRPLLKRREELKIEINKLIEEYKAIGDIILENIKLKKEKEGDSEFKTKEGIR